MSNRGEGWESGKRYVGEAGAQGACSGGGRKQLQLQPLRGVLLASSSSLAGVSYGCRSGMESLPTHQLLLQWCWELCNCTVCSD